ncbi:MAG: hypothetical protein AB1779_00855 [Candidatus Thermoplasmatota archaeon]
MEGVAAVEEKQEENKLEEYYKLTEQKRKLEKDIEELKKAILIAMGESESLIEGDYIAVREERERTDIDKDRIKFYLTEEQWNKITRKTSYQVLTVKKK